MSDLTWLDKALAQENNGAIAPIDILFSDFSHSSEIVSKIVAQFLPRMSEVSSIFIDSASTSLGPYLMLERIVGLMQAGKVPKELISLLPNNEQRAELRRIVAESTFKLNHLTEKKHRAQNSTAWLRTEPAAILAGLTTCLH